MKRINNITIHLTDEENELIEVLAEKLERKPSELVRLLAYKKALEEWGKIQAEKQPSEPFKELKF